MQEMKTTNFTQDVPEKDGKMEITLMGEPLELLERRRQAWEAFRSLPVPKATDESWRFMPAELFFNEDVTKLLHGFSPSFVEIDTPEILSSTIHTLCDLFCHSQKQGNNESMPNGVFSELTAKAVAHNQEVVSAIFDGDHSKDKFDYLIDSLFTDGLYIRTEKEVKLSKVIGIHSPIPHARLKAARTHIEIQEGAEAEVILWMDGGEQEAYHFGWMTTELRDNAKLKITVIQVADKSAHILWRFRGRVKDNASLFLNVINLGGGAVRNEITAEMNGRHSQAQLFGLTLGGQEQQFAILTAQNHLAPKTASRLRLKQVFAEESRGAFDGIIRVPPNSAGSDAYQENHNLLLSRSAKVNSIPRLEIQTDDVRCTHGATVKYVAPEEVFYLRSRGLRESVAKHLLVSSFLEEMTRKIEVEPVRNYVERLLEEKVRGGIG